MSINSLDFATKMASELDKMHEQKAVTGFLADNVLRAQFVGAKTVKIPDLDFVGLVDYDRDNGFNRSKMTVANIPFTMEMDRARSIQIDREDLDETGVANLAGKVMGEYVRTKVVPECDAYVLSKLASIAAKTVEYGEDEKRLEEAYEGEAHTVDWDLANPYKVFNQLVTKVWDKVGYDEELVCFIDSTAYAALMASNEISKMITVSDFKQGGVNTKVKSINGVALIPVSSSRMMTGYTFVDTDDTHGIGGFTPLADAQHIRMLVLPKSAGSLVKKTEKIRIFTPEQNLDADAYKFDYRIYYDVFVKKSGINSIWGSFEAQQA